MKIRKGDTVKMLYGKDSGRQGAVVAIDTKKERVVVEGLNMYKRNLKGDGRTRVSEIVTITKSVPVSKVMLVCPSCNKATRVGYKIDGDKKVRVCKKCGKAIEQKIEEKQEEKKTKKSTTKKSTKKKTTTKKTTAKKKTESKSKSTKSKK
jgi:large subunit ribosomal protein L24